MDPWLSVPPTEVTGPSDVTLERGDQRPASACQAGSVTRTPHIGLVPLSVSGYSHPCSLPGPCRPLVNKQLTPRHRELLQEGWRLS